VLTATQPFTTKLIASNQEQFKYCWVWMKSQPGDPMNAKNRPMRNHEDVCVFSDGTTANCSRRRMTYNPQGVAEPPNSIWKSSGRHDDNFKSRPSHPAYRGIDGTDYPRTVIYFPQRRGAEGRVHPTQKPVALMEYLIRTYTNEGEAVLDFCMGSGTTLVAATRLGRASIGIELNPEYCELARRRLVNDGLKKDETLRPDGSMPLFGA
jgi:site-specific DNA-methyltransferase (adenine-specific)